MLTTQPACAAALLQNVAKNGPLFPWSKVTRRAANLIAADELTDVEIAKKLGISRMTLHRWKKHSDFVAKVQILRERLGEVAARYAVTRLARRLHDLDNLRSRLLRVMAERAADPDIAKGPGGATGLVIRVCKQIGRGEHAQLVEEFLVDVALLREFRAVLKQAAIEVGQWGNYQNDSKPAPGPVVLQFVTVPSPPCPREVPVIASVGAHQSG